MDVARDLAVRARRATHRRLRRRTPTLNHLSKNAGMIMKVDCRNSPKEGVMRTIISAAFLTIAATPALASPSPAQSGQPQQPAATANIPVGQQIVCEKQPVIGSRLTTHKICLTRDEWARARSDDKDVVDRVQRPGYTSSPQ